MDGSDKATREIEENYYGSVKELSIDNPLMKEAIELDHAIKKLKSLQKGFRNEVANAARQLSLLPTETDRLKQEVEKIARDQSLRAPEPKGEEFRMVIGGKEYAERREAGLELINLSKQLNEKARVTKKAVERSIGSYAGLSNRRSGKWHCGTTTLLRSTQKESITPTVLMSGRIRTRLASFDPFTMPSTKGWTASWTTKRRCLRVGRRQGQDWRKWPASKFTKAAELEEKESRYKEVVEAIQAHNMESRDGSDEYPIDWEGVETWPDEKVREEIERYLQATEMVVVAEKGVEVLSTVGQVLEETKNLYGLELPRTLQSSIDKAISEECLKAEKAMDIIERAIRDFDERGPSWVEGNGDGLAGSYARRKGVVCAGDVLIRKVTDSEGEKYRAFLVTTGRSERFLGGDSRLSDIRERARRFYIFNGIAIELRKEVELSTVGHDPRPSDSKRRVEQDIGR